MSRIPTILIPMIRILMIQIPVRAGFESSQYFEVARSAPLLARGWSWLLSWLLPWLLITTLVSASDSPVMPDAPVVDKEIASPIGIEGARHLLGRTIFGAPLDQLQQYSSQTREQAVDRLLETLTTTTVTPLPPWASLTPSNIQQQRGKTEQSRMAFQKSVRRWQGELRGWWARELISTPSPLTERLVLLWHGHFTSELTKVRSAQAMLKQNQMFRQFGSGDFRQLLHRVALDPAMAIYLDTRRSTRDKPNENFARELLELFGLGEGNYSETDILEAARAFTGYRIDQRSGALRQIRRRHDAGEKTVLGVTGPLTGADVVDAVLAQPACAEWISRRFWTEFISPNPDEMVLKKWAEQFKKNDWSLRSLLRVTLLSEAFWAEDSRGSLIKSPVDLVVGTIRSFQIEGAPAGQALRTISRLGQQLFDPPNVAGWPGGHQWIDATTLLGRRQFLANEVHNLAVLNKMQHLADRDTPAPDEDPAENPEMMAPEMMAPENSPEMRVQRELPRRVKARERRRYMPLVMKELEQMWQSLGDDSSSRSLSLQQWLLPFKPVGTVVEMGSMRNRLGSVLLDPTYQLK
ncbi:MAG: DUF1800 domain-containing protein [Planctomycetota bacterium]|nr:DUF1800 domain-containing protein [Planctomycetota bacterium]